MIAYVLSANKSDPSLIGNIVHSTFISVGSVTEPQTKGDFFLAISNLCKEKFSVKEGYRDHGVLMKEVPEEMILEAAQAVHETKVKDNIQYIITEVDKTLEGIKIGKKEKEED